MKPPTYRQCTRCVMDTSDPEIAFDDDGRCSHCSQFLETLRDRRATALPRPELARQLVEEMREAGRGRKYDCVLGISGGADSAYAAHAAVSLGLRVLGVHLDNGWDTALAVRNIKNVVSKLGIGYASVVLDWDEFKDLQLAFLKASVPEIETPTDIAIPASLHRVAAAHGVRYIVLGGNSQTEGILPRSWHYDPRDLTYLQAIHRQFGTRKLRTFPTFGYKREIFDKLVRRIRFVYLLEHVAYSTVSANRILKELDWRAPAGKHHESTITRFVQSYVLPVKFGIDYRRATLSTRICSREITRAEALRVLKHPPFDDDRLAEDKRWISKKFGITRRALEDIIASPPKSHVDYPNDQRFLEAMYTVYRAWFRRRASRANSSKCHDAEEQATASDSPRLSDAGALAENAPVGSARAKW